MTILGGVQFPWFACIKPAGVYMLFHPMPGAQNLYLNDPKGEAWGKHFKIILPNFDWVPKTWLFKWALWALKTTIYRRFPNIIHHDYEGRGCQLLIWESLILIDTRGPLMFVLFNCFEKQLYTQHIFRDIQRGQIIWEDRKEVQNNEFFHWSL